MTAAAAVMALIVGTGEAHSATTTALLAAAEAALGPATTIRVREVQDLTEAEAIRVEREMAAGAVVVLIWNKANRLSASLRLHVARSDRWTTRAIAFDPRDTLAQRGRTLGLAVASMWPETGLAPRHEPPLPASGPPQPPPASGPPQPPAPDAPVAPEPSVRTAGERPAAAKPAEVSPAAVTRTENAEPAPEGRASPRAGAPRRFWIGAVAEGATGVGGPSAGLGGHADGAWFVSPRFSLAARAGLRAGTISELPGTQVVTALGAGGEWWPLAAAGGGILSAGFRADLIGFHHRLRDTSPDGRRESKSRFVPGADLVARIMLRLGPRLNLLVGGGVEVGFGVTEVRVGVEPTRVATIPALRAVVEAGFRVGF